MPTYDAIVIGAGHNGLTAGAYLARAGLRVLILERRGSLGGLAAAEELFPGFRFNTGFPGAPLLLPEVVEELALESHGLDWIESPLHIFAPQPGGQALTIWEDPNRTVESLSKISTRDAQRFPAFLKFVQQASGLLAGVMSLTPPELKGDRSPGQVIPWAKLALNTRRLGERDMMELLRVLPMSAREFLDEWFESPALKGVLGVYSTFGTMLGPMGMGTALNLLYHLSGGTRPGFTRGGTGGVSAALAKAAQSHGAEIRTGVGAKRVWLENGTLKGVLTTTGDRIRAPRVVSSADPRHTFLDLVGAQHLPVRFVRRVRNIRFQGTTASLHLALESLPDFGVEAQYLGGQIVLCPGLEALEKAYDDAKYGRFSKRPALLVTIPSLSDPSLAPEGQHTLSALVRYAPFCLREGDWEQQRSALEEAVLRTLSNYAPKMGELILHKRTLTPSNYASEYGLAEGAWMHGQMGLDQLLFMRPTPGAGRYRTPLEGFFLCGSGSHPGGGLTAAPGKNAAREIIKLKT